MNTTSSPAYLPYLNFGEHVGFLIAGSFAIFCNFRLLYYGLVKRKSQATITMSSSIYVLIFSHTALLFASLPYAMFMVWKKANDLNEFSAYAIYWTGLPANCYMVSSSIPIFFLTLDRRRLRQFRLPPGKVQTGDKGHIGHKNDIHNSESYTELLFFQITSSAAEF
ncbi:hypothetical protein DdX_17308 [Ditylenchus destructor]|uniref:Uncharacterized protein n=1 Tax=Ditylenchus destructor TaxID=166010 RepID=A0AAD4MRN3_9BILA|nr:hypothetical protein DdX_17308 [Ditylenchus destructor]